MDGPELYAYGQLAQAIATHLFAQAKYQAEHKYFDQEPELPDLPRPLYHQDFMSTFEDAARDLLKLGVLSDVFENTRRRFVYFSFNCSPRKRAG